ncbi:hypothetical protein BCR43DRAFT_487611 [Syncephalastrum racemosum]|uniref:Arrestin-like N-terminal domain-containing protein n=1 Tax=Syncephalastrum racemosum TaxID=13706 RepID=A0A1X2HHF6_SYNRA|nr:hypothetical protein BCR43DRAFT_487611 [Syncephalastrum racemosum]
MFRKSLSVELVEPVVYLRGHAKDRQTINILRGVVRLQLSHPVLVHSVTVQFVGTAKTLWPEDKACQYWDKHILVDSVIPISRSPIALKKGIHAFPFEILLSNALSESVECGLGHVRYKLHCQVHIKPSWSLFTSCLRAQQPVVLVRLPQDAGPRCINQTHRLTDTDDLHILVETAHITPGTPLALSFAFSRPPAAIHHLCVKLIERQKFRARSKRTTRILHHEITLTTSTSLADHPPGHNELRCVFAIPDKHTLQVHPSTYNPNIRVRHWIQILLRFTLHDGTPKEVLMDAPVSVLMETIEGYTTLPAYPPPSDESPASSSYATPLSPSTTPPAADVPTAAAVLKDSAITPTPSTSSSWLNKLNPRRSWRPDVKPPPSYDDIVRQHASSAIS